MKNLQEEIKRMRQMMGIISESNVYHNNLITESNAIEMSKPSGDKLEWPCPENQYWDVHKRKCVNYGFSDEEIPKTYSDTYSGMDDYYDQQQKEFIQKLNDKKDSDKIKITPLFEKAKTWWRNWLSDPKTKSKHMEMFGLSVSEVEDKFKNYLKVIDNVELVVIDRYGRRKNVFAFVSDAYIDPNLSSSSLGHIYDKEYDALIQNGSNEITAWLGALVSTVSGGNDINDCRVFVPSPLIGELRYYEQTFAHEIQHLLEDRVGLLTSTEVVSKSFPIKKEENDKIGLMDLKKSVEVLERYEDVEPDEESVNLDIPEELKLDLSKGIKDLSSIHKPQYGKISEKKSKDRIKDLIDSLILNSANLSYNCEHSEKTANFTEIRNKLNIKSGEKMDWIGVLFSYWTDGWVNEEQQIEILPVYRTLACWILNNFTPDLKTLFENLDNFVMNDEKNTVNPTQPVNDKNLDLAHIIRKYNKIIKS